MAARRNESKPITILRHSARILFILWAAFWIFFNVASGVSETASLGIMALITHLLIPIVALITLYFVWREELLGGILLLLEAAFYSYFFHPHDLLVWLLLPLPLVISGVLLIICWGAGRMQHGKPLTA